MGGLPHMLSLGSLPAAIGEQPQVAPSARRDDEQVLDDDDDVKAICLSPSPRSDESDGSIIRSLHEVATKGEMPAMERIVRVHGLCLCVVCMSAPNNALLLPCKHVIMCGECTKMVLVNSGQCPLCRENITEVVYDLLL
mmetsp:Transcript_25183/g.42163  ORF Transcript_25183/g.42163 Transcript_25183/m.42163 type:complete len:139 (-) Transcript_25183:185-601(-)|eukprot:CAMPEP_0198200268 /NCGR_PEP_ID=MMETSP1445-20131203/3316_1 /TAXON_ID=36898 /ORGANISM="Pyramimonas sp., Strain CCMP2087" /LENGTH=138 /DNA_ID=CAMNT_0043870279 /DNA_START=126 /DNA_END=542 /DNA_ORIENTATION=+